MTGDLPPRRSNWAHPRLAQDPYAAAFGQQLERVKPAPKVPEWEQIATEMRLAAERVTHGN
jgi:multiple sugar transport system substrate-binding protein